eukprot:767803-Hanusia_phi.AAC.1
MRGTRTAEAARNGGKSRVRAGAGERTSSSSLLPKVQLASLLVATFLVVGCESFYLPGVAPTDYMPGEKLNAKVRDDYASTETKSSCACWSFLFPLGGVIPYLSMPLFRNLTYSYCRSRPSLPRGHSSRTSTTCCPFAVMASTWISKKVNLSHQVTGHSDTSDVKLSTLEKFSEDLEFTILLTPSTWASTRTARYSVIRNTPKRKCRYCEKFRGKRVTAGDMQEFALMIEEEYRAHFLLDNLPVAMTVFHENGLKSFVISTSQVIAYLVPTDTGETTKTYETGYPIGHVITENSGEGEEGREETSKHSSESQSSKSSKPQIALFNHLRFTILYHEDPKKHAQRIVGFEVEPLSVKHTYLNKVDFDECLGRQSGENGLCNLNTCSVKKQVSLNEQPLILDPTRKRRTEVLWTYDVIYQPSKIKWSTRWDTYLQSADDAQVHWFSILNSFMIVLFLSGLIAMIMIRTLRKDFDRYQRKDVIEEGQEETGWKLVHGDVFRPPVMSGWLSVMIGTGVQLSVSACFLMIFACFGFLSPANRGALMQAMLFLFVFMGMVGGYTSARLFRMFKGNRWKSNSLWTAMLYPGFVFALFFVLNLMIWGQKSSGAVPFGVLRLQSCCATSSCAVRTITGEYNNHSRGVVSSSSGGGEHISQPGVPHSTFSCTPCTMPTPSFRSNFLFAFNMHDLCKDGKSGCRTVVRGLHAGNLAL